MKTPKDTKKKYADDELQHCYEMGRDAKKNGASPINCHFSLFRTPEMTRAWEKGNN